MGLLLTMGDVSIESGQIDKALDRFKQLETLCRSNARNELRIEGMKVFAFARIGKCYYLKKEYPKVAA
jgi:hypothetical protein